MRCSEQLRASRHLLPLSLSLRSLGVFARTMQSIVLVLLFSTLCLTAPAQTASTPQPKSLTKNADVEVTLNEVFWTGMTTTSGDGVLHSQTPTDSICLFLSCSLLSDKQIDIALPEVSTNGKPIARNAYFLMSVGGNNLAVAVAEASNPLSPKHRKSGIFLVLNRSELQIKDSSATVRITKLLNLAPIDVTFTLP